MMILLYLLLTMALSAPSVTLDHHCVSVKEGLSVDLGSGKVLWQKTVHPFCAEKGIYWLVTDLACHGSSIVNFTIAGDEEMILYIDETALHLTGSSNGGYFARKLTILKMMKQPVELVLFPGGEHENSGSFANKK